MCPRDMWLRLGVELGSRLDRAPAGARERALTEQALLRATGATSLQALHCRVIAQPMGWGIHDLSAQGLDTLLPGAAEALYERARVAMEGWVRLMGPDLVKVGGPKGIDWHRDHHTGLDWPFAYFHDLDPADLDRPSDVKFPWELSRLQWLLPVAQAWRLSNDDCYAAYLRATLEDWIDANPTAWGINWACTMEPAMRLFTLGWMYQCVGDAPSWSCSRFRFRLLRTLYQHLAFVRRYIEITDVNGNHLTAAAAALVVGGCLIGGAKPTAWRKEGWRLLRREILTQVYPDGVDFEGSVPYHRLVAELFHYAAMTEKLNGGAVPPEYRERLLAMAAYSEAYTRPDGLAPVWGDNDDARTLPLGGQSLADHRYLPALIRGFWAPETLTDAWRANAEECLWHWGEAPEARPMLQLKSRAFPDGGSYVLRGDTDYVFFDCGPLGLAQRGGHGHNDILAFEAVLCGCPLVTDPGCLSYTGDWQARNAFRSTAAHSTVQIDDEEINRFISPRNLWFLHGDAEAECLDWQDSNDTCRVRGRHSGYRRLSPPVDVERELILDKRRHELAWTDIVRGCEGRNVWVTLQLDPFVSLLRNTPGRVVVASRGTEFEIDWEDQQDWSLDIEEGLVAPSYGLTLPATRLRWHTSDVAAGPILVFSARIRPKVG